VSSKKKKKKRKKKTKNNAKKADDIAKTIHQVEIGREFSINGTKSEKLVQTRSSRLDNIKMDVE
jgi:hypothetical protein